MEKIDVCEEYIPDLWAPRILCPATPTHYIMRFLPQLSLATHDWWVFR